MAIWDKEAARQIIDALPDDATFDDISLAIRAHDRVPDDLQGVEYGRSLKREDVPRSPGNSEGVPRRLVRKGHITVLEPTQPVPPLTIEIVNEMIDEMRREREDRFFGLPDRDG